MRSKLTKTKNKNNPCLKNTNMNLDCFIITRKDNIKYKKTN